MRSKPPAPPGARPRARRLRTGVIGTGIIAQLMHLPYLAELADLFEITAVCDLAGANAQACADRYGARTACTDWRDLISQPLDAVLVATSGSHAPIAIAAAQAGLHVLVEKPMCFSAEEGTAMLEAAGRAGVTLMVGYPKRYDPAYGRLREEVTALDSLRLLRVTTLESPFRPYIGHYPLLPPAILPPALTSRLRQDTQARVDAALGGASELEKRVYHGVLLDTLVHELNSVRGLLGEPDRVEHADLSEQAVTVLLRFGDLPVAIHWIDLPGIARYEMEFACYAPQRRVTLRFPSPYLRNEPSSLITEGGDEANARSWRTEETLGYESGFRRELEVFHACVVSGAEPETSGRDGLTDIMLCQAIIECHRQGRPAQVTSEQE